MSFGWIDMRNISIAVLSNQLVNEVEGCFSFQKKLMKNFYGYTYFGIFSNDPLDIHDLESY